jgi:hypothetical protein
MELLHSTNTIIFEQIKRLKEQNVSVVHKWEDNQVSLSQPEVLHDIMLCRVSVDIHALKYCHVHLSVCISLKTSGIVLEQEPHSPTKLQKTIKGDKWHEQEDVHYNCAVSREESHA